MSECYITKGGLTLSSLLHLGHGFRVSLSRKTKWEGLSFFMTFQISVTNTYQKYILQLMHNRCFT